MKALLFLALFGEDLTIEDKKFAIMCVALGASFWLVMLIEGIRRLINIIRRQLGADIAPYWETWDRSAKCKGDAHRFKIISSHGQAWVDRKGKCNCGQVTYNEWFNEKVRKIKESIVIKK